MRTIYEALKTRILLSDGASEKMWADMDPGTDQPELLNITRPEAVRRRHEVQLKAGTDVIHTNTFGAFPLDLAATDLAEEAFVINHLAAEIAARAVDSIPGAGRRRFVVGVIQTDNSDASTDELQSAASLQAEGLLSGGADGIAIFLSGPADRSMALLRGALAARDRLASRAPVYLYRRGADNAAVVGADLCDGVITLTRGRTGGGDWLDGLLDDNRPGLVFGECAPDTAVLDRILRSRAPDGLRPFLDRPNRTAEDNFMPASSSRRFPQTQGIA